MAQTGYSQARWLLKGAIIQFSAPMLVPIPNIIAFQYNPETLSRTLSPFTPLARERTYDDQGNWSLKTPADDHQKQALQQQLNALAQPFDPDESFSVALELDALDEPDRPGTAVTGVAERIAALEMLCYPPGESAIGGLLNVGIDVSIGLGGFSASASAAVRQAQRKEVPVVLFFWGPGRIVPVRITTFSVEEQAFSPLLYPIRAKVTVGMKVLSPAELVNAEGDPANAGAVDLAKFCYHFTRVQKEVLATANVANSVDSILGMLPF